MCGSSNEVTLCPSTDCALWIFRSGKRPNQDTLNQIQDIPILHTLLFGNFSTAQGKLEELIGNGNIIDKLIRKLDLVWDPKQNRFCLPEKNLLGEIPDELLPTNLTRDKFLIEALDDKLHPKKPRRKLRRFKKTKPVPKIPNVKPDAPDAFPSHTNDDGPDFTHET